MSSPKLAPWSGIPLKSRFRPNLLTVAQGAILVSVVSISGCGPTIYSANAHKASKAVESARHAHAAEHAPFEYHFAVEHLDKAREEAGHAGYQSAIEYARVAREYGEKARELARRRMREMGR
jgi:hypothetical protein